MKKMISFSKAARGHFSHFILPELFICNGAMPFNKPGLI
jgi:hypothetical protein